MTTLLILLSLCTLICSDSLSHFQNVVTNNDVEVFLVSRALHEKVLHVFDAEKEESLSGTKFDGSVESCAEQCLLTEFFCRSFVVVKADSDMYCIMSHEDDLLSDYFHSSPTSPVETLIPARIVGAFNIKYKIDNVAEITKAPTLLRKDQFDKLLEGYGFSKSDEYLWGGLKDLLTASLTCLYIPKSTPTNLKDWIKGMESSGSASTDTHSGERPKKRIRLDNTPEFDSLARIDLFIRGVNRNAHSIYDPSHKFLYIYSERSQILIWTPNERVVIWSASGDSTNVVTMDVATRGIVGPISAKVDWQFISALQLKVAKRAGYHITRVLPLVESGSRSFWSAVSRMALPAATYPHNVLLLVRDLTYVVSILHDKPQMEYTERIQKSSPGELVDIFTQSE